MCKLCTVGVLLGGLTRSNLYRRRRRRGCDTGLPDLVVVVRAWARVGENEVTVGKWRLLQFRVYSTDLSNSRNKEHHLKDETKLSTMIRIPDTDYKSQMSTSATSIHMLISSYHAPNTLSLTWLTCLDSSLRRLGQPQARDHHHAF